MEIDVSTVLKVVVFREVSKMKGDPLSGNASKEIIVVEVSVIYNDLNRKRVVPRCQSRIHAVGAPGEKSSSTAMKYL